jgi:hypothetical protein
LAFLQQLFLLKKRQGSAEITVVVGQQIFFGKIQIHFQGSVRRNHLVATGFLLRKTLYSGFFQRPGKALDFGVTLAESGFYVT